MTRRFWEELEKTGTAEELQSLYKRVARCYSISDLDAQCLYIAIREKIQETRARSYTPAGRP